jgi:hypothetical protein
MRVGMASPQMTSAEFTTAMREAGFGVDQGRIVDVSGQCPGFATLPTFNKGSVDRNATLSKVLFEREAEISRRPRRGPGAADRPAANPKCHRRRHRHGAAYLTDAPHGGPEASASRT